MLRRVPCAWPAWSLRVAFCSLLVAPAAAVAGWPSPADWRDVVVYQIVTDRFANGNPANDAVEGNYAPSDGYRIHGGDFAGVRMKLDYIQTLGADAVWISPVVLNANAEYHGYAARDFFAIAPHFGTLADLRGLADDLHARGMYLVLDVVVNHMGDLIYSRDAGYPTYKYPSTYSLRWRDTSKRYTGVLDNLARFHAHGQIGNFTDPEQILGELFGLDDLKTEDPVVEQELERAARFLIDSTDCDGFRIDTVKHTEMTFWSTWAPAVRAYAVSRGKTNFFLFGEAFDGSDVKCGSYTGTIGGGAYKLDSVLHYPMYYTTNDVFAFSAAPANVTNRYAFLGAYDPTSQERLVTFLENHDNARFLSFGVANQDESRMRAALGMQLTSRGVPCLYYGGEQEFDGGGDPWNREDMWDGAWDFGPSEGDNFDLTHPLFVHTRRLVDARRRHEALRRGTTTTLFVDCCAPGLYVYQRTSAADTVVVAINTSNAPIVRAGQSVPWPSGTHLRDALEPSLADTVGSGPALTLRVPARGARVLESLATRTGGGPDPLRVLAMTPGHDQTVNDLHGPLVLVFDRAVDASGIASAFTIAPPVSGSWTVSGTRATFVPASPWTANVTYQWSLAASLAGSDGASLSAAFASSFRTTPSATGITVPPGYTADRIARQGLTAPEGLLSAAWLIESPVLVADTGRDRVFTLTPGADLGHWLGDSRWTKPEGLALAADGRLAVIDEQGVFLVDARRMTTQLSGPSSAAAAGAGAWGGTAYGNALYLCDPSGDRIVRVESNGSLTTFASGVKGGEGIAFGPGGAWGTDMYVADANLTSLGSSADGLGRIVRVAPNGAVTTFVQNATLLAGVSALVFDATGLFGGGLLAADILGEKIYTIAPDGTLTEFASGFNNLSGSHCLAFGGDGALYAADPGSGQPFSNSHGTQPPQVIRIASESAAVGAPEGSTPPHAPQVFARTPSRAEQAVVLRVSLARESRVHVNVYEPTGRYVCGIDAGTLPAGSHSIRWDARAADGRNVGPGLYLAVVHAGGARVTQRLMLVR